VNRLKQLSVGKQVWFTSATLCAILLIIGGWFYFSLRFIEHNQQWEYSRALKKLALVDDIGQDVGQMQAAVLREVVASDVNEINLLDQGIRSLEKTNAAEFRDFQPYLDHAEERRLYDEVMRARKSYWEQTRLVMGFGRANQDSEAAKLINAMQAPAYDRYLAALNRLIGHMEGDAADSAAATTALLSKVRFIGNILVAMAILVALATGFAVARVGRRLKEDNRHLQAEVTERNRAAEALRASRQILEGIINAIPVRVFWKDKNLVYLGCNAAFARDAGFADPKDIIGKDDYQMGWRDHAEKYREDDRQVIASGCSKLLIEEPQTTPQGNTITILTSKILLCNSEGKTSGMIGTYLDITERKRAEEELQRKTAFLEAQVNSSIDGILVVDQNRETSLQNQRFVDLFKMPRHLADAGADVNRLRWVTDLVKNPEQFLERVLHLYAHPNEISHDEIELKDGTILDRYTSPAIGKDGKYYGRIWTYRDITVRKRAEVRLQQSERRTRAITDSAQDAILMMDPEGQISYWNPAAEHIFGYTSAEALGQNLHDLIAPARFLPAHHAAYPAFLQTGQGAVVGKTVDLEARRKDGLEISIQLSLSAVQMNEGWHALGIIRDTTERKRAEEALQERAKLATLEADVGTALTQGGTLAEMLRLCGEAIVRQLDVAFARIWTLNEREQMLELQASAGLYTHLNGPHGRVPVGQFKIGLIAEERKPHLTNQVVGDPRVGDQQWAKREGMVAFAGYPLLVENRLVGVCAMFARHTLTDTILQALASISNNIAMGIERHRSAEELRASQKKFQDLFEGSRDAIMTMEPPSWKFTSGNPAAVKMFGAKSEEDFISHRPWELSPDLQPDGRASVEKAKEMIETAMREGSHFSEWTHRRIGGEEFHATVLLSRMQSAEKVFLQATVRDITQSKRAQVELEHLHKQLVETSRLAGMAEIATNVLHNVGNVLNSVNISTGLIVDSVKNSKASSLARVVVLLKEHAHDLGAFLTNDPSGQHVPVVLARLSEHLIAEQEKIAGELDSLRRNVEHIKEIVAMQQNYAMVGGVKEEIDLVSLVEDSLRLNESALSRHGMEVVRELAKVPPMNVEKHKILQILVNLVRNAKHACDDSGRADRRLTVRVANGEGRVKISVVDNGIGIPLENLTRIFNYGFTTRKGGHGFGLHSSALAAKEMGGSLTARSGGPGQGADFTLELPCPTQENSHE
jgi:PAS domain S-box-containing protein